MTTKPEAGGVASPVDLEALEKRFRANAVYQKAFCVCWLTNPDRCGHCEHIADCVDAADLFSELRAWRSQQVMIAGLVNGYYNGSEPDAIGAFRALRAIADVLGKPMEASPLP